MWKLIKILDKPESVQRIADEFRTCIKKELEIDAANIDELEKLFAPTEEKLLLLKIIIANKFDCLSIYYY